MGCARFSKLNKYPNLRSGFNGNSNLHDGAVERYALRGIFLAVYRYDKRIGGMSTR